jgi:hypothetical protein
LVHSGYSLRVPQLVLEPILVPIFLLYDSTFLVLKIIDFGDLKFLRTIVYEEDNIDSLRSNSIEQNDDADMNFDDLITLC